MASMPADATGMNIAHEVTVGLPFKYYSRWEIPLESMHKIAGTPQKAAPSRFVALANEMGLAPALSSDHLCLLQIDRELPGTSLKRLQKEGARLSSTTEGIPKRYSFGCGLLLQCHYQLSHLHHPKGFGK